MSLTGDTTTDALVPIAQRFVGAVRDFDPYEIDEQIAQAIYATGGKCDPHMALCIVLAAMVPEDMNPSALLQWLPTYVRYQKLVKSGMPEGIARHKMRQGEV